MRAQRGDFAGAADHLLIFFREFFNGSGQPPETGFARRSVLFHLIRILRRSILPRSFVRLSRIEKLQKVEVEDVKNDVRGVERQGRASLQDIVDMGLGDAGEVGQAALGELAASDPIAEVVEEASLQLVEVIRC